MDIEYLASGTERQKKAYLALKKLEIFETLKTYRPLLAGTIPISIDNRDSDLDIVCCIEDPAAFAGLLKVLYGGYAGFGLIEDIGSHVVVCNFSAYGEKIEIYASPVPTHLSNAFLHMIAEEKLLRLGGDEFRGRIIALKSNGLKTEPAFAEVLALSGNPYEEILQFVDMDDERLRNLLSSAY